MRHVGNCLTADLAYGKGMADPVGIPYPELPAPSDRRIPRRGAPPATPVVRVTGKNGGGRPSMVESGSIERRAGRTEPRQEGGA
jgi:hypothetical protein